MRSRIRNFYLTLVLLAGLAVNVNVQAQCCAMGNPFNNIALSKEAGQQNLQVSLTYKYGYYETYFRERVRLINYGMYREISYQYLAMHFSYGITERLGVDHELGYFISKAPRFADPELDKFANAGQGLSNGILSIRYAVANIPGKQIRIDASLGIRYPFSQKPQSVNGIELPIEAQPSTGAFGGVMYIQTGKTMSKLNLVLQQRYEFNTRNYNDYTFGDVHITALSVNAEINPYLNGLLLLRNEVRGSDKTANNARLASEGSHMVILAPQIGIRPFRDFQVSIFGDIPVYRRYFGEQISSRYALGVSLLWSSAAKNKAQRTGTPSVLHD